MIWILYKNLPLDCLFRYASYGEKCSNSFQVKVHQVVLCSLRLLASQLPTHCVYQNTIMVITVTRMSMGGCEIVISGCLRPPCLQVKGIITKEEKTDV